jgi:hypothetical protein
VARAVLPEDRAGGGLDQVGERAALAARVAIALVHVRRDLRSERSRVEHLHAAVHAQRALLVRDAEVAQARLVGRPGHRRPDARVEAREDAHPDVVGQGDRLAAGDGDELPLGDAVLVVQQAHGLVRPDDDRSGLPRDPLGTPEVVEMRVPDQDEVRALDLGRRHADGWCCRNPVDVGVEEDRRVADREAEGGDAEPVEDDAHAIAYQPESCATRSRWKLGVPKESSFTTARLNQKCMSCSQVKPIPPCIWTARFVTLA